VSVPLGLTGETTPLGSEAPVAPKAAFSVEVGPDGRLAFKPEAGRAPSSPFQPTGSLSFAELLKAPGVVVHPL
jgi:hypothetical protein